MLVDKILSFSRSKPVAIKKITYVIVYQLIGRSINYIYYCLSVNCVWLSGCLQSRRLVVQSPVPPDWMGECVAKCKVFCWPLGLWKRYI